MPDLCEFDVEGIPRPAGGLRMVPQSGGRWRLAPSSSGPLNRWKRAVKKAAEEALDGRPPYKGAVGVDLAFYMHRPKTHSLVRGLRPDAPAYPIARASNQGGGDFDKLTRAVCDALTDAGVFADDSQVVDARIRKRYTDDRLVSGATIRVYARDDEEDLRLELDGATS